MNEMIAMQKEIDTLNENIKRKDEVIADLYEIIFSTKDMDLMRKTKDIVVKANFGDMFK